MGCVCLLSTIHVDNLVFLYVPFTHTHTFADAQTPPSWETLKIVALQRAVPFMGFGFMDNGGSLYMCVYMYVCMGDVRWVGWPW